METVKFNFNIESLGLVLYHKNPEQVSQKLQRLEWFWSSWSHCSRLLQPTDLQHQQDLKLGEFFLRLLRTSGKIMNDGSMEVSTVLTTCTLDDLRTGMDRVTSR